MKRTLKKHFTAVLVVAAFVLSVAPAATVSAAGQTPRVNRRQSNQSARIRRGVRSGSLTRRETNRLVRQQSRVRRHEARIKSDGTVTRRERASLTRHQNRASRNVYRQKHDRRHRD